jgi:hypothetical protein
MKNESSKQKNRSRIQVRSVRKPLGSGAGGAASVCAVVVSFLGVSISAQLPLRLYVDWPRLVPISAISILE